MSLSLFLFLFLSLFLSLSLRVQSSVQLHKVYCTGVEVILCLYSSSMSLSFERDSGKKAVAKAAPSKKDSLSFFLFDFSKGKASVDSTLLLLWMEEC